MRAVPENAKQRTPARSRGAAAGDQVAAILAAAEESSRRIVERTEARVRDRIAEGERAAQNRVGAAEDEAAEILESARAEATRLREQAHAKVSKAIDGATSDALAIVARAQENADDVLAEARKTAAREREAAETRTRELLRDARSIASDVRSEGLEVVGNLRELGGSLRANAERLLQDVQSIHTQMVSRIERIDGALGTAPRVRTPRPDRSLGPTALENGEVLDVPEFIPPA